MKIIKSTILVMLIFTSILTAAQANRDSGVSIKVYGACIMCKERIEKVARTKGVISANWNESTQMLALVYRPSIISLDAIRSRIVAVGHDLEDRKSPDAVYNALPACCHYRPVVQDTLQVKSPSFNIPVPETVNGVVLETDPKGRFVSLAGASVMWLGTREGVLTDSSGVFHIRPVENSNRLVVSFTGYRSDTLETGRTRELKIILAANRQLREVTVTSKLRPTYLSAINPIRTQVMTEKELFKAACCNLSESFETNPAVDVSYNDAVTGSKQIQLLGLAGIYTQLTVENLPGPRGLATAMGLNSIAGPWVESIQLTKGTGSVANGFESIAGQINVELKKPEAGEKWLVNGYVNDMGKTDLNLNASARLGKYWHTGILLHDDLYADKKRDVNRDGFRDLPYGHQFSLVNRWQFDNGRGWMAQLGFKFLTDKRTGGETGFEPSKDKYTTNKYGLGFNIKRHEGFLKLGYVFPQKKYKSAGLQLSFTDHRQDAYYGLTRYDARQDNLYANFIYQSIIGTTMHKFRTGISLVRDQYAETIRNADYKRTETVPGAFFEYTFTPSEKITVVAGIRVDQNNLYGAFLTPRLHIRYAPWNGATIRLSAGRGQRSANVFAENTGYLVSSRQINIPDPVNGKAYGLDPEVAWNKGVSFDQKFKVFARDAMISLDYFRNDFSSQAVVDIEDPGRVSFYNLEGRSFSNAVQAEFSMEPIRGFDARFAYRFFDVRTAFNGKFLQRPLVSRHRAFANLAYANSGWKFDFTFNYIGKKRIPSTISNPPEYQRGLVSPGYVLMNAQVSKTIGKRIPFDVYLGAENLGNYRQKEVLIAPDQPFGPYFDASLVWGPVTGRLIYIGFRLKIK